ncbi:hypothetical protein DMB65_11515 [Flavobacterium cheongpyeongense]|uniref:Restriction endonuclease type IV Mrr domain-containing protein n=1 Tax=Flavobacterium cheongpyeongense TaxID=2212651 RepID=A0A2V4BNF1_9FLAO|nr:hypothetical protein [Flavobacterium cheongpyeongense]PXY40535.1 hypothetical protein DMB65_11515 [Flavobacterium cheongpyeongense]
MEQKKKISPQAILSLKEALSVIYWRKEDLQQFIKLTIDNTAIIGTINWSVTKREIVKELLNRMTNRLDLFENDLMNLILAVTDFNDFSNLQYWDEDGSKTKKAKEAVNNLRSFTKGFIQITQEQEEAKNRKAKAEQATKKALSLEQELFQLKEEFNKIAINRNFQQRGFKFEKFLYSLFLLFDLEPKGSFKIHGEQIDGAFTFQSTDYLLEAKWASEVNRSDLATFCFKVETKFKNAAGLLISIDGVTSEAISSDFKSIIIMDGIDLLAVLDNRITLPDLLFKKRRKASETGNIYINFNSLFR